MKTTLYGNGKDRNEMGIPKVPKETHFVHPVYAPRDPLPMSTVRGLVEDFYAIHNRYPRMLYVAGGSVGTKFIGFMVTGGAYVGLDVIYGALETKVA
jgi:hypothetical protein